MKLNSFLKIAEIEQKKKKIIEKNKNFHIYIYFQLNVIQ